MVKGQPVFITCPSCQEIFNKDTTNYMKVLSKIQVIRQKENTTDLQSP